MKAMDRLKSMWDWLVEGPGGRLLLLPALVLVAIFVVFPIVWNFYISLTNYRLIGPEARAYKFVGLSQYIKLLTDPSFYNSLNASFLFVVFSALIGQAMLGLALALAIRMKDPPGVLGVVTKVLKYAAMVLVFLSWIVPEVVGGYAWLALTDKGGLMSVLMGAKGCLYVEKPLFTIIVANIWRGTAFSMILFMAALESIPQFIYEAAEVDGATGWVKFRYIILPLIAHAILVDFILITIWTYAVFTMPFIILGPSGQGEGQIWTLYVYYNAMTGHDVSYAAAAANIMFLIVLAMIIFYLKVMKMLERW